MNTNKFFVFLILFVSSSLRASPCGVKLTEPLSSQAVESAIQICGINSTRDLRYILPKTFRANFTFMRKSPSAFASCINPKKLSPRVIMFSPLSDLIIAMPWEPGLAGNVNCNAFETMELNNGATEFTLKAHLFAPQLARGQIVPERIADVPKCISCHGPHGVPIWHVYPEWKTKEGSEQYGFNDDNLIRGSDEANEYDQFLNKITRDGSGFSLIWPENDAPALEKMKEYFSETDKLNMPMDQLTLSRPPYQYSKVPVKGSNYDYRPGFNLARDINRLNAKRIYNKFRQTPNFEKLKLLFAFSEENCVNISPKNPISARLPRSYFSKDLIDSTLVTVASASTPKIGESIDMGDFANFIGLSKEDVLIDPDIQNGSGIYFNTGTRETIRQRVAINIFYWDEKLKPFLRSEDKRYNRYSASDEQAYTLLSYSLENLYYSPLHVYECQSLRKMIDE